MKPVHHADMSQSCSCTSCTFRNVSQNPSVRRLLKEGTEIDKLYLGQYIPLREKKLLNKLVRTRAVYDDIRNQLVSGSSTSFSEKPDLKPRRDEPSNPYELDDNEKGSTILKLVDMVDKGKVLEHKHNYLSECCSCCICVPTSEHGLSAKPRRHRRGHKSDRYEDVQSMSRASIISRPRIGDVRRRKSVRFKAKSIRSEPCTCITKLSGVFKAMKKHSDETKRKLRHGGSNSLIEPPLLFDEGSIKKRQKKSLARKPYQKHKRSESRLMESMGEGMRKLNKSREKLKDHIEASAIRSIGSVKHAAKKIRHRKSTSNKPKKRIKSDDESLISEESLYDNYFSIKKDSIAKYKEYLERRRRHRINKYKPCKTDCLPGDCDPEECYRIIKRKRRKRQKSELSEKSGKYDKAVEKDISVTSSAVNTAGNVQGIEKEIIIRSRSGKILRYEKVIEEKRTEPQHNIKIKKREGEYTKEITEKPHKRRVPKVESTSINTEQVSKGNPLKGKHSKQGSPKQESGIEKKSVTTLQKGTAHSKASQPKTRSVKSMTSIPTVKSSLQRSQSSGTIKHYTTTITTTTTIKQSSKAIQKLPRNIKSPKTSKTKGVGQDGKKFNQKKQKRNKNKPHLEDVDTKTSPEYGGNRGNRQAVKISSSFNFNLEFYRDKPLQKMSEDIATEKYDKMQGMPLKRQYRTSQTKFKNMKRGAQTSDHNLKRCFCTLKLMTKGNKPKINRFIPRSISSATQSEKVLNVINPDDDVQFEENTQTKDSYMCPLDICIPNECDPYECLKEINRRKYKNRTAGGNTKPKKTRNKSMSSMTSQSVSKASSRDISRAKAKGKIVNVNKPISRHPPKYKYIDEPESNKQVVRIQSTFSFNVEFNKQKTFSKATESPVQNIDEYTMKPKRDKGSSNKRHIRNKRSQMKTSSKSKNTLAVHGLRRCFCTLQLTDKRTKTTRVPSPKLQNVTRSIGSGNNENIAKLQRKLLPYECEPGICIPNECDPHECLKIIKSREMKFLKRHTKFSNTDYRGTKSTSSFASRTTQKMAKKIQSSEFPNRQYKGKKHVVRMLNTTPNSPERQVVRIGSTFSFNIEFNKSKENAKASPQYIDKPISRSPSKSLRALKKPKLKTGRYQKKEKKQERSTSMLVKRKITSSTVTPSMKRCFCTLKLQTDNNWDSNLQTSMTVGTLTPVTNNDLYDKLMLSKGTKTKPEKIKTSHVLEPYECEPYTCVPGECDPYQCLERIEKRMHPNKDFGTSVNKSKMKSASSTTPRSMFKSRSASVKSKIHHQKALSKTPKTKSKNDVHPKVIGGKMQRQAVRIGSNFSFNIELKKEEKSHTFSESVEIPRSTFKPAVMSHMKEKGLPSKKKSAGTRDTQVSEIKRVAKFTGIRPMLKKCFCTLKLQNKSNEVLRASKISTKRLKTNKNNIYTVSRVTVDRTNVNKIINANIDKEFPKNEQNIKGKYASNIKMLSYSKTRINAFSLSRIKLNNNLTMSRYQTNVIHSSLMFPTYYENQLKVKRNQNSKTQILNINQFLKQRYYALNLHLPEKSKKYKLKPYECESGVCIPDECDPYECQKLIMRRLRKRESKMSGTDLRSKSVSSSAAYSISNSTKKMQSKQTRERNEKRHARGITYSSPPNRGNKQAVRVGSSFSFNIEFSKDRSAFRDLESVRRPVTSVKARPRTKSRPSSSISRNLRTTGTRRRAAVHHDQDTQSITETQNKGIGMKPMMKRCFCTLKLHKKGKLHKKELPHALAKGTATPLKLSNEEVIVRAESSQNTQRPKPLKFLPYECEPNICVPGQCDPYECLERIKRRNIRTKNSGTDALQSRKSMSSMTAREQVKTRTQGKQINRKLKRESQPSNKFIKTVYFKPIKTEQFAHQAVRIGSSFSFNIEFYKDKNDESRTLPQSLPNEPPRTPHRRYPKPSVSSSQTKEKIYRTHKGSQGNKRMLHENSQVGNMLSHASTMTASFMKRCFCTANLHRKENKGSFPKKKYLRDLQEKEMKADMSLKSVESRGSQAKNSKTFLEKCFCILKLKGAKKEIPTLANVKTETDVKTKASNIRKLSLATERSNYYHLKSYECEPGVCIPGECNPYQCEKLIKARNLRHESKSIYTSSPRTKSTSSSFKSLGSSKGKMTQSNFKTPNAPKSKPVKIIKNEQIHTSAQPVAQSSSDRQAVRIGSHFSFNVEFYKQQSYNTDEVQDAANTVRQERRKLPRKRNTHSESQYIPRATRNTSSSMIMKGYHKAAQAYKPKTEDQATGVGTLLKRCFCTLKLHKQHVKHIDMATEGTETPAFKEIPTLYDRGTQGKKWKLKPYECEPNVCIPDECDPYECEKLIKKRLLKESNKSVGTDRNKRHVEYNLLPYECEPGVCVPGECDPYECEKLIKLRNMKYQDSGTLTKRMKSRSITSDIRSTTSSKARKIQAMKRPKYHQRSRSVASKSYKPIRPHASSFAESARQSVRIGSGFSFDIEFFKDKSLKKTDMHEYTADKPIKIRKKNRSITSSYATPTRSRKMQYYRTARDSDSQSQMQRMKDSGVNPFLKRCFCTMKLQKSSNHAPGPHSYVISRSARDQNVYIATLPNLLPYECEPGICVPGQCDPYECEKRIKRRLLLSQMSGTDGPKRNSAYSSTFRGKCNSMKCQAKTEMPIHKQARASGAVSEYTKRCATPICIKTINEPKGECNFEETHGCKVGSSFNFNVEFYKKNRRAKPPFIPEKLKLKKTTSRAVSRHEKSKTKSISSDRGGRRHHKLQTTHKKCDTKCVGPPLLKRCFCTLALQKKDKDEIEQRNKCFNISLKDYLINRERGMGTRRTIPILDPDECEPGVCIPGECDPYECYERILLRRIKDCGTGTPRVSQKCASSLCKEIKCKSARTQSMKEEEPRRQTAATICKPVCKPICTPICKPAVPATKEITRFGSNITFNIEFYKEKNADYKLPKHVYRQTIMSDDFEHVNRKNTGTESYVNDLKSQKICCATTKCANKGLDCEKPCTRSTGMNAMLRRCFCTLNLRKNKPSIEHLHQDKPVKTQTRKNSESKDRNNHQYKHTADGTVFKKSTLNDYECEPNTCIPGQCDPYACLERIKLRQMRQKSRRAGTNTRPSQESVSSTASKYIPRRTRRVQSTAKRVRRVSQPQKVPTLVEEPRFTHLFDNTIKHLTRYGSNVSFNVEFYKNKSCIPLSKTPVCEPNRHQEPIPIRKVQKMDQCITTKHNSLSSPSQVCFNKGICNMTQVDPVKMKDKAEGVHNMLKRCFCTLKLHKKEAHQVSVNPNKVIKVNRLEIENTWISAGKKSGSQNKTVDDKLKSNMNQNIECNKKNKINKNNQKTDTLEMQTLYPYIPSKFNKNISKTGILQRESILKDTNKKTKSAFIKQIYHKDNCNSSLKHLSEIGNLKEKTHYFKSFFMKCTGLLSFSKNKDNLKLKENIKKCTSINIATTPIKPLDILKTSKSDRPTNFKVSTPKKSHSLKVTKLPDNKTCRKNIVPYHKNRFVYSHFQCGDTVKGHSIVTNNKIHKLCVNTERQKDLHETFALNKNCKEFRSPYEDCQIVQMALISPAIAYKNKNLRNFPKIPDKKSNEMHGKDNQITKTYSKFNKTQPKIINYVYTEREMRSVDTCCPCPKRRSLFSRGDASFMDGRPSTFSQNKQTIIGKREMKKGHKVKKQENELEETVKKGGKAKPKDERVSKTPERKVVKRVKIYGTKPKAKTGPTASRESSKSNIDDEPPERPAKSKKIPKSGKREKPTKTRKLSKKAEPNEADETSLSETSIASDTDKKAKSKKTDKTKSKNLPKSGKIGKSGKKTPAKTAEIDETVEANLSETFIPVDADKINPIQPKAKPITDMTGRSRKTGTDSKSRKADKTETLEKTDKAGKEETGGTVAKGSNDKGGNGDKGGKGDKGSKGDKGGKGDKSGKGGKADKGDKGSKGDKGGKGDKSGKGGKADKGGKGKISSTCICHNKVCICGSKKCAAEYNKLSWEEKDGGKQKKEKPCVCGAKVCEEESRKKHMPHGKVCECRRAMEERRKKEQLKKLEMKIEARRRKRKLKEEKIAEKQERKDYLNRMKARRKADNKMNKLAQKTDASDSQLLLSSVADILRLGLRTGADVTECTAKAIVHPKRTVHSVKRAYRNPSRAFENMKLAMRNTGCCSTGTRIKTRIKSMKSLQSIKESWEETKLGYFFTLDQKKKEKIRKRKLKKKQQIESMDFECSAFMASLRKKPYLCVYFLCPWFYPHCLSLANVWRQFTDLILFLLAVLVWSPFILCMEICRALMCCFFCTG